MSSRIHLRAFLLAASLSCAYAQAPVATYNPSAFTSECRLARLTTAQVGALRAHTVTLANVHGQERDITPAERDALLCHPEQTLDVLSREAGLGAGAQLFFEF